MSTTCKTSAINDASSSPNQHCLAKPPSIGGELGGPKIAKYKGRFCCSFLRRRWLKKVVNASHSSFCISASHSKLKLDLAREREFHACVLREREW